MRTLQEICKYVMNDFTKEELETLYDCVVTKLYSPISTNARGELLSHKIATMIYNYCEHESCSIDYDHQPLRCKTCAEIVE